MKWLATSCRRLQPIRVSLTIAFFGAGAGAVWGAGGLPAAGDPVVGRNADGHLEVFRVEADGEVRHRWQKEATGDWSSWTSLGGGLLPGLAVATNAAGRLHVFGVDRQTGALACNSQRAANAREWSGWRSLGGQLRPPVAVAPGGDGTIEVFVVDGESGSAKRLCQVGRGDEWGRWEDFGGHLEPGLVVARNLDGRLEVFGRTAGDQSLVHRWQLQPGRDAPWAEWARLGRSVEPGFAVGRNVLGVLEVFAVNRTNQQLERIIQSKPGNSRDWSTWQDFNARVKPGLTVGQSGDRRLEVFAIDAASHQLLHRWETMLDGSDKWSAWAKLGIEALPVPAVIQDVDGDQEVFARDRFKAGTINHRRQISGASDWLDWSDLDQVIGRYSSRTWQTDEGLPHNTVQAIAQTPDGYLWVGTPAGLARFDGVSFAVFDGRNTPQLTNSAVSALGTDRQGALWVGTLGGGLLRFSGGVFTRFGRAEGLPGETVNAIYESRDGALWVGTASGLARLVDGRFKTYTARDGLFSDAVRALCEDREGNLWIATGGGLNQLRAGVMDGFPMPKGLPNDSVRCICQDRGGRVWIGSNNGMLWYNWYWMRDFYAYNTRFGLSDTFVSAICEDQAGNLWVGTYSGLNRFHEGRFFPEYNHEGLPFGRVNTLFVDREGDLWVGSTDGLARLTPKPFFTYKRKDGLTHNHVTAVCEDHAGALWLGTWGGGLNQLKDEKVTAFISTNDISQTLVLSLAEARDGSLWVGADFDGGLSRLKDGSLTRYSAKEGLIDAPVRVLHQDRSGTLWVGTGRGLCWLKEGATRFSTPPGAEGLAGHAVQVICEDHAGAIWIGTDTGLAQWRAGSFTEIPPGKGWSPASVTALYEDRDNSLWVGTAADGLRRCRAGQFTACTTAEGLFSDEVFEILEDNQGWLWMSCSRGVFRVRKADFDELERGREASVSSIVYGKADGLETVQCNGRSKPAAWKTRDGRLWFATNKGLLGVDPAAVTVSTSAPPVYVEALLADKKLIRSAGGRFAIDEWQTSGSHTKGVVLPPLAPGPSAPIVIPPGRGELEIRYTALQLQAPDRVRFEYQLEGLDSEWVEAGTRRAAHYDHLSPGRYRFQVIARSKDGVWSQEGAVLDFVLAPHFWQTWWFLGGVAVLVIGGAGGAARYVTHRRLRRKLETLEQRHAIERERGRIAQDIHDDLGSSLTRILMLGERAEEGMGNQEDVRPQVRKIVASARATVQSLDEIVWAVNPENDTLEGLVQYLGHYANEFFENANIYCRLEMPTALPPLALSAEARHDLFLVVKEAFNNIVKHAQATEVRVEVAATPASVEIRIADNGKGLPAAQPAAARQGNGLRNMCLRLATHGGRLEISGDNGHGTALVMKVPFISGPRDHPGQVSSDPP